MLLAFDDELMQEKERLIAFHHSQVKDPSFPHKELSFIDLAKRDNKKMATSRKLSFPYAECYKKLSL